VAEVPICHLKGNNWLKTERPLWSARTITQPFVQAQVLGTYAPIKAIQPLRALKALVHSISNFWLQQLVRLQARMPEILPF
jgi:hypothetical protein